MTRNLKDGPNGIKKKYSVSCKPMDPVRMIYFIFSLFL